jgi:hypothetical protein
VDRTKRPVSRLGDRLDDLLDLLDQAREEQRAPLMQAISPAAPYLALVREIVAPSRCRHAS